MKYEHLFLKDFFKALDYGDNRGELICYLPDNCEEMGEATARPSILIIPGGGYHMTCPREAEPVALQFLANGYNAFVLQYSVKPVFYPCALLQACAALALIRRNKTAWHVDVNKLAVLGFSAGGHLAANVAVGWSDSFIGDALCIQQDDDKPNAVILCYPVISGGEYGHKGSFDCLLGEDAAPSRREALSVDKLVNAKVPPCFIWHTAEDDCVSVENSMLFARALLKADISTELHIFPYGQHGLSLCNEETTLNANAHVAQWLPLAFNWLDIIFEKIK